MQLKLMLLALVACAACLAPGPSQALSIESKPVKVTQRNSGPRYDLDEELDKSKLTPVSEAPAAAADASNKEPTTSGDEKPAEPQEDQMPIGQVSIRRFLLVPVMRPARPDWQEDSAREPSDHQLDHQQAPPTMFAKPFWPFLTPARPSHHLFGADEASRSPQAGREPEREREREREREDMRPLSSQEQPAINPFQLMLEMMQQALNGQLAGSMPGDLNEGASSTASERGNGEPTSTSEEKPQVPASVKPQASNETREDIVEIEGKKYLRKTLINRHVGENIIFMTKRLIFVPLNETESTAGSDEQPAIPTSSTTEAPLATSTNEPVESRDGSTSAKPIEEATTSTTTGTPTTMAASEPTTTTTAASVSEQPSSTQKESLVERVSEALEKVAERVAERVAEEVAPTASSTTSTTEKPASS